VGFFQALFLPLEAWRVIRGDAGLRRLARVSAFVSALCFAGLIVGLWFAAPSLVSLLWTKPAGWTVIFWDLAAALLFVIGFVVSAQTVPVIVLAPLSERLSIQTERSLGKTDDGGGLVRFVAETGRSIRKAILRVTVFAVGHACLLLLWIVPGYGQAAWSAAVFLWSALWLAFEYVDITANRHGLGFRAVIRFLRARPGQALGLGAAIYLLLWVPFLNVFFVPLAVVSAALLFTRAER
jgi:CysZ protein